MRPALIFIFLVIAVTIPARGSSFEEMKKEYLASHNLSREIYKSRVDSFNYDVNEIRFEGAASFGREQLILRLNSDETSRSIPHKIILTYKNEIKKNETVSDLIPRQVFSTVDKTLEAMENQVEYYNEKEAEADLFILKEFYSMNGFHFAETDFGFFGNPESKKNVLVFFIKEGPAAPVGAINYVGLGNLPEKIRNSANSLKELKVGRRYNETEYVQEAIRINKMLRNNGYFYSQYFLRPINIIVDSLNTGELEVEDSLTIVFKPGIRQKIRAVYIVDSARGWKLVSGTLKKRQIAFKEGDWYSAEKIGETQSAFYSLGVFDLVRIDTTSAKGPQSDSSLIFTITLYYRPQAEWDVGLSFYRLIYFDFINSAVTASWLHRNLFGAAQSIRLFAGFELLDLSVPFNDFSTKAGLNFAQPQIWKIDRAGLGLAGQIVFDWNSYNFDIRTTKLSARFALPVKLPSHTAINNIEASVLYESEDPNDKDLEDIRESADNPIELQRRYSQFEELNKYIEDKGFFTPTSFIFAVTLRGDHRSDIFSPISGYYWVGSWDTGELGLGIARYNKLQFAAQYFTNNDKVNVWAFKFKTGGIAWDTSGLSYIPYERQLFSGGANSLRGWPARQLRHFRNANGNVLSYYDEYYADVDSVSKFYKDTEVQSALFQWEASIEYRWSFSRHDFMGRSFGENVSNLGVTFFLDIGQAYGLASEGENGDLRTLSLKEYFWDYVAMAAGLGIRYQTPVGPVRLDFGWPVRYPSTIKDDKWIWNRPQAFNNLQFHISIGHAF